MAVATRWWASRGTGAHLVDPNEPSFSGEPCRSVRSIAAVVNVRTGRLAIVV
jgi:hypothetical protein